MNALNINSSHSPTKFSQPAHVTTHLISVQSTRIEPAAHPLSP